MMRAHRTRRIFVARPLAAVLGAMLIAMAVASAPAMAEDAPGWEVESHSYPAHLAPGGEGHIGFDVENIGGAESAAGATLTDVLPAGLEPIAGEGWTCTTGSPGSSATCELELPSFYSGRRKELELKVKVLATVAEGVVTNVATVFGGGAPIVSTPDHLQISSSPAKFGFSHATAWFSNADGTFDTQAGSHPYAFTFSFDLNTNAQAVPVEGEARDVDVNLPPGVIGNPNVVARCTREEFDQEHCPADTQIGVDHPGLGGNLPPIMFAFDVYNLVPPPGHPAEFGFFIFGTRVLFDAVVRSDGNYGITELAHNLPQRIVATNSVTIWGDPADSSHNHERCNGATDGVGCPSNMPKVPFLTTPSSCAGPLKFSATADDWLDEGITSEIGFSIQNKESQLQGFEGCDQLNIAPSISAAPDTTAADTPAGLSVEIKVPQEGLTESEAGQEGRARNSLAPADIKDTTVTLPEGVVINPGQATGLTACPADEDGVGTLGAPSCPGSSQVGTDEIETPLLAHALKGDVYVLQSDPPDIKLLVAASGESVNLKLVGDVRLNEQTGRLTTTFQETPELPFTTFRLSFSGGARAALATPVRCGTYTTSSDFTPWSTPFEADVFPFSSFLISTGPGGGVCPGATLPFTPSLTAGSTTDQAGGYTDFSLLLTRPDGQQRIGSLQFRTPEGLLGMISKVALCGEPQASQGDCPAASQIGHTVVEAGPGPYPLVVPEPGQEPAPIYLTGGYKGAPYGLSIVVPLHVGPFTLQTQIVRASIAVDPKTAQLTVTTDPLPSIIDGVPADLRAINAVIDRPGFMFNPTSCEPQSFSGTATSAEGASAPISSHFQMGSCRSLEFHPNFKVATSGKTSRANGASLDAKILYPTGKLEANQASSQANIAYVKVELPKALPSRLTTLQKACLAQTFEEDPARCPTGSLVGSATAITPVLPVPLTGPAYFVSHGGEAFPSLIVVLQGYGVTVDLIGTTFISKTGITSSTFKQVPDVPITSFELKLPEGPYSALAANGNLCRQKLAMPTAFIAQNGATVNQSTPVEVEGCSDVLAVKSKKVRGRAVTLGVWVPAAGHLTAGGRGLIGVSKPSRAREEVQLTLHAREKGKFTSEIRLTFTPSSGKDRKKLGKSVSVRV
jgi:hypothetical protein